MADKKRDNSRSGISNWKTMPDRSGVINEPWQDLVRGHDGEGIGIRQTVEGQLATIGVRVLWASINEWRRVKPAPDEHGNMPEDFEIEPQFKGASDNAIAEACGMDGERVRQIRNGINKEPVSVAELCGLSKALGVHPGWLLGVLDDDEAEILRCYADMPFEGREKLLEKAREYSKLYKPLVDERTKPTFLPTYSPEPSGNPPQDEHGRILLVPCGELVEKNPGEFEPGYLLPPNDTTSDSTSENIDEGDSQDNSDL